MFFVYDFRLMDDNLEWVRENVCLQFWKKPELPVQFTRRPGIEIPPMAS
jgi:hypothetical protein